MEDVTDVVFRQIVADCGRPDVFFTEFTNAAGMFSAGAEMVKQRLVKKESEKPIVAQIWGITPENYYKGAKEIVELGFDGVDINMGCPVKKIVKQGACSALIDNPTLAKEIVLATKEGTAGQIPVSVKTRLGFSKNIVEEWSEFLLSLDIDVLTMHGRVAKHESKYPADWDEIAKVVEIRNKMRKETLIIGNGDVLSLEDLYTKAEKFGVDGIMVGRGIFQDPFLFNPDKTFNDLSKQEKIELLLKHARLFEETWGSRKNFSILKRFFKIYLRGFDGANELRSEIMNTTSLQEVEELLG